MGAPRSLIRRIFILQGTLLSIIGGGIGLAIGIILCLIQQYAGIIEIPGSYIINAYPVQILLTDILITITGIILIGYLISLAAVKKL